MAKNVCSLGLRLSTLSRWTMPKSQWRPWMDTHLTDES